MPVEYKVVEWIQLDNRQQRDTVYSDINKLLNEGWKLEGNIVLMYYKDKNDNKYKTGYAQALTRITPRSGSRVYSSSISGNNDTPDPGTLEGGRVKRFTRKRR